MLLIIGTWIFQAMSHTSFEDSFAMRHEQWMAQHGRNFVTMLRI